MSAYQSFIFETHSFDPEEGLIELAYSLDESVRFVETFRRPTLHHQRPAGNTLDAALQLLHMLAGVSYYKTCCPKEIIVRSGSLSQDQAKFFETAYENGLGEFAYRNKLDLWGKIQFPGTEDSRTLSRSDTQHPTPNALRPTPNAQRLLVPLGGGKDSIVTVELLKKAGFEVTLLRVGNHPLIAKVADIADVPLLTVDRRIDPELFRANTAGALNGHVPITGILSALAVVVAELGGFDAVVWSNERSSSYGNVEYKGHEINHQWSKGLEFERMLQNYLKENISTQIQSFSLLRPWSELKIAEEFVKHPEYFEACTSCNTNWKLNARPPTPDPQHPTPNAQRWCLACPKCAFAFALFAAFLPRKQLESIFGGNCFAEAKLLPIYRELLGVEGFKPFECVGTPEEVQAAFVLGQKRGELNETPAMQRFMKDVAPKINDIDALVQRELQPSSEHSIPETFIHVLPTP